MEKSFRKPKANPRPLFNFGGNPETTITWKKSLQK